MRDKKQMFIDLMDKVNIINPNICDIKDGLWDLGYRRLEPSEILILEMLESDTPIDIIEKYREESL